MEALRKMTLMPAQRLAARVPAMRNKGRSREGADADIIVFDADRIIDRATFQAQRPSEGVRFVLVNGVLVVRDGVIQKTCSRGGRCVPQLQTLQKTTQSRPSGGPPRLAQQSYSLISVNSL